MNKPLRICAPYRHRSGPDSADGGWLEQPSGAE